MKTYYTAKMADGQDTPAQAKKLGTAQYGYATLQRALRYTPKNGYVEKRYQSGADDWADNVVCYKED